MRRGRALALAGALAIGGCAPATGAVSADPGDPVAKRGRGPRNGGGVLEMPHPRMMTPRVSRSEVRRRRPRPHRARHHLTPRQIGRRVAEHRGWGAAQWRCLETLWTHESGWNPHAANPSSTAYGIAQFLRSTWSGVGGHRTSRPRLQIVYGLRYIESRYGSPCGAWRFWTAHRWY